MKRSDRKNSPGFTLVEIMIVVVIIGFLAALALPAIQTVKNATMEKTMVNDARQVTSALQQFCTENGTNSCPSNALITYMSGGKLSSGVTFGAPGNPSANDSLSGVGTLNVSTSPYFYLKTEGYNKSLSINPKIKLAGPAVSGNVIKFSTENGEPVP